ncbi:MAG: site-specific integrase [Thermoplasmata archaeon]|nr:site-specific integrase [Thermoplasmata archaeon]MBE3142294.1 site-specific integrase [Thermoplasmata archaeon]
MNMMEKFFEKKLLTNPNTKRNYERGVTLFFEAIGKEPETYFKNGNDYEADISKFFMAIQDLPSMSEKNRMNAVKQFLISNDRTIKDLEIWDTIRVRIRGAEPVSEETPLEQKDIYNILQYGDICSKAMFLMMSSSGMRMESLSGLLPTDIHDDETPTRIVLRPEIVKGKKSTVTTFITPEATDAYHSWMKVRSKWLESAIKRTTFKGGKKKDDDRVFPMTDVNIRLMWRNMLTKAGYDKRDKKTNRSLCHPHGLRKFFRSWLGNADLAEVCMGHKGYLSTYRQYTYKQLGQEYLKQMNNLNIFSKPVNLAGIHESLKAKDEQIASLQKQIDKLEDFKNAYLEKLILKHEEQINGKKH